MGSVSSPNLKAAVGLARRHENRVYLLKRTGVVVGDERASLLGGKVVLVVHARGQHVGAEQLTALGLGAKAARTALGTLLGQLRAAGRLRSVADAVDARAIGQRLGAPDHVVGGDRRNEVRQIDLDELGALIGE